MTVLLLAAWVAGVGPFSGPETVVVATSRGMEAVPVAVEFGHPALPTPLLEHLLPLSGERDHEWATVRFAGEPFRFLLGAPLFVYDGEVRPLVGGAYVARDTLFLPLQWFAEFLPKTFATTFSYDPTRARFEEIGGGSSTVAAKTPPPAPAPANAVGLRFAHKVVVDAGHGGRDPGSPGRYLPRGVKEKHVTLALSQMLERELERRGIDVIMTRDADVFIPHGDRAAMCHDDCDLFVSVHVNAAASRSARGFETYFLDHARTEEAARVAAIENESLRYEADPETDTDDALSFIVKDLQRNEYLRESAQLADFIQRKTAPIHPGGGRYVGQANFAVLRGARRPAVLVETGYGSNPQHGPYLASNAGQRRLATGIAEGIVEYLRRYEDKLYTTLR